MNELMPHGDVRPQQWGDSGNSCNKIVFQQEALATCLHEAVSLLGEHYEEIAEFKHLLVLDPDYSRYEEVEKRNGLRVITARENGRLVGYIVFFIYKHLHYKSVLVASDDIHFICKEKRAGSVGIRLFREGERALRAAGVKFILVRCKAKHDHSRIFEHLGYRPFDIMYAKELGDSL